MISVKMTDILDVIVNRYYKMQLQMDNKRFNFK